MRPEKQLLLDAVKDQIKETNGFVLVSYENMSANLNFDFRQAILENGGSLCVVKKRIFLKAASESGIAIDEATLLGHLGVIYSGEDIVKTAKIVRKYEQDYSKILKILSARFEGKICSPQEVEEISRLPNEDGMRAQFLSTLVAPMSGTLGALQAALTGVIYCIEGKIQKQGKTS